MTALCIWCVGCIPSSDTEGKLYSRGGQLGTWDMTPDACFSGERREFFGVDLEQDGGYYQVRLIEEGTGAQSLVVFFPDSDRGILIEPPLCTTFEASLRRTNTQVNEIWVIKGDLLVDCTLESGGHFYGEVAFDGCA